MKYMEMEEENSSDVDKSVSKRVTGDGMNSSPATPMEIAAEDMPSPLSHGSKDVLRTSKDIESQSDTTDVEPQTQTTENGNIDPPLKGTLYYNMTNSSYSHAYTYIRTHIHTRTYLH